ncbi:hypothetical protein SUGI_0504740 [Cryptomeria japonica]|nr:hypothetical protein SUGI_0504740 [Cryptomeria japonica]
MPILVNGRKGGYAEDVCIDFSKELKEDVVFWEDFAIIAKIIGLNWPRKEIRNWVEFYIQPWAPHFDPTPLAVYFEPVWIQLYNLSIEYWSEELWEKIGRTLGTLLETDFDDVEDICKCARMKIAAVKKIPERITLVSEFGEWSQKVEIDKEISRCTRCGSKFHGEKEYKSLIAGFKQSLEKESTEMVSLQKESIHQQEIRKITEEKAVTEIGEIRMKEIKVGTSKGNPFDCSINIEEVFRDSFFRMERIVRYRIRI